jgi:cyclophilin family peptidyl-prolyl cis-trans isomerase
VNGIRAAHLFSYISKSGIPLKFVLTIISISLIAACNPTLSNGLRKKDLRKDVEMVTSEGSMVIRLSDSTPLHRDNFLRLVKQGFYDSIIFHRVIKNFMIQAGNPSTKGAARTTPAANMNYTIAAEFRESLFHRKGVIAAARTGDNVNPQKASSGTQFYIVQGKRFTDAGLDSVETFRLNGRKLPLKHREAYKTVGGTPHLDQNYTVFGELIEGADVVDKIAAQPTSGNAGGDKPLNDIRIVKARLIKRENQKR